MNKFLKMFLILSLPFLLWILLHFDFFSGKVFVTGDNLNYFHSAIYHFQSLMKGVFPLWVPFQSWGMPENFDFRTLGDFNPFLHLIPLLMSVSLDPYWAFLTTMVLYFWVGCLGVYVLARLIFQDKSLALLTYILWMFSNIGVVFWQQFSVLTIIVPSIWFFVFLTGFLNGKDTDRFKHALGITFVLMIILTSYIPFFFLTVFLCIFTAVLIVTPGYFGQWVRITVDFCRKNPWIIIFFIFAVVLSMLPWLTWYIECQSGQNVLLIDRAPVGSKNPIAVDLNIINIGGLFSQISWLEMFADFDAASNFWVYIPFFVFIILGLSILNRLRKNQLVLFLSGLLLFLIASTNMTPVHGALNKYVFIFKLFRNYFYFWQFLTGIFIFFIVGELKELLSWIDKQEKIKWTLLYVLGMHVLIIFLLMRLDGVPISSFLTIIFSGIWFGLYIAGFLRTLGNVFLLGIMLIALIQPIQIYKYYNVISSATKDSYVLGALAFSYERPMKGNGYNEQQAYYGHVKSFRDESGFVDNGYVGVKNSYQLLKGIAPDVLKEYVRYKFVIYDKTVLSDFEHPDFQSLTSHLAKLDNVALVDDPRMVGMGDEQAMPLSAQGVSAPSQQFKVLKFTLNSVKIQTHFSYKKFLVYNDSFYRGWTATIDGKPTLLCRTNLAFKGIWVPQGDHQIVFTFYPLRHVFYMCLLSLFWFLFIWLLYLGVVRRV